MFTYRFFTVLALGTAFALQSGCASVPDKPAETGRSGKIIAVMPLDNHSSSVAGALYMREEMVEVLKIKGYEPLELKQTDQQLANLFGISLGGQIMDEDIPKIAAGLKAEAIMTGTLKNFDSVLLSYNEVAASFTLYEGADWSPVWNFDGSASVPFSPLRGESLGTQLLGGLVGGVLERTVGKPMQGAVSEYYHRLQGTLPTGWRTH
jgi:hypothetical protein